MIHVHGSRTKQGAPLERIEDVIAVTRGPAEPHCLRPSHRLCLVWQWRRSFPQKTSLFHDQCVVPLATGDPLYEVLRLALRCRRQRREHEYEAQFPQETALYQTKQRNLTLVPVQDDAWLGRDRDTRLTASPRA